MAESDKELADRLDAADRLITRGYKRSPVFQLPGIWNSSRDGSSVHDL